MELAVVDNGDGTFSLTVDGQTYVEQDGETVLVRESVEVVKADARVIFGGNTDTLTVPAPVTTPDSAPAPDPIPAPDPNPVPPAVAPSADVPTTDTPPVGA